MRRLRECKHDSNHNYAFAVDVSGYGHEGGIEGLEAYTNRKFISQA